MGELSGVPGVRSIIADSSAVTENRRSGIICVQGPTGRGEVGKQYLIGNWAEFRKYLGGLLTGDDFPLTCKRALEAGAVLRVARAFHYTDVTDKTTVDGTEATAQFVGTNTTIDATAKAVGADYNGIKVTIVTAKSGNANQVDITIDNNDGQPVEQFFNVPAQPSTEEMASLNYKTRHITFALSGTTPAFEAATLTLATGAQTLASIVEADYEGDQTQGTGWYTFDGVTDSMRIANIAKPTPEADADLITYVEARKDMRAILRTPNGLTIDAVLDYRLGQNAYSHTPYNSIYADLWVTGLVVPNPNDVNAFVTISGLGDYLGYRSQTDRNRGVWISASGTKSPIKNAREVELNLLSKGYAAKADEIYEEGVNFIGSQDGLIMPWGNRSTFQDGTQLTSKSNIADLVVHILRETRAVAKSFNFEPNDVQMFNQLYRSVRPFIKSLVQGRAIDGANLAQDGENQTWFWIGDQFATSIGNLSYNDPNEVLTGKYRVRFIFLPIGANEYIELVISPTDYNSVVNIKQILQP